MKTLGTFTMIASLSGHALLAQTGDWKLVWSDEFNRDGAPNPSKWAYEEGFVRNNELQYYTAGRLENARIEGGNLIIEAHKEPYLDAEDEADSKELSSEKKHKHADYTSASLTTRGRASWTYGRIEVRAKLPSGRGTWPAIWTLGTNINKVNWPACGEIDIMEYVGHDPGVVQANVHTGGYHHAQGNGRGARLAVPDAEKDFHVYACEWTPERLVFFVDDQKHYTLENDMTGVDSWPFDAPQYLILNLAIGGNFGGKKGVDDSIFPQRFLIDYVRIYQRPGAGG